MNCGQLPECNLESWVNTILGIAKRKNKTKSIPDLGKHTVDSKFGCNDNLQTSEVCKCGN